MLPLIGAALSNPAIASNPDSELTAAADSIAPDSIAAGMAAADSVAADSVAKPKQLPALPAIKSTPVDIDRDAPSAPPLHYYDRHGEPLETPVRFLAELDTVTTVKSGPKFRTFNGVSIGANFFDAVMMVVGQERASFDLWAECSIHNWFFPVVEAGIAFADAHPDDGRCHFKVAPSVYARIGMNYNFLYKSNPDYQFFLGLRAGWSTFNYNIYDIQPGSEYYVSDGPTNRTGLSSTAFYGQALAGLKVKIWRGLFMGWSVRYNFDIHQSYSDPAYPAWFTPGKGTSTPIAATFSIGYTFGTRPPIEPPAPDQ